MKTYAKLATTAALLVASTALAQMSDNFDTYSSSGTLSAANSAWTATVGSGLSLTTVNAASSPNAVMNTGATSVTAQNARWIGTTLAADSIDFKFSFYDNGSGNARDYAMLYDRTGTTWAGAANQIVALGKYNAGSSKYYGRVAYQSATYQYANGAVASTASGWFTLNNAANVSAGQHTGEISTKVDSVNGGNYIELDFYIDNVLGGSILKVDKTSFNNTFNWAVLGSGTSSTGGFLTFDDVRVSAVPEPSSIALCLLGGLALTAGRIFRRGRV